MHSANGRTSATDCPESGERIRSRPQVVATSSVRGLDFPRIGQILPVRYPNRRYHRIDTPIASTTSTAATNANPPVNSVSRLRTCTCEPSFW